MKLKKNGVYAKMRWMIIIINSLKEMCWTKFEKQFCNNLILGYEKHKTKFTPSSLVDYSGGTW
jgi:hypothetical protein